VAIPAFVCDPHIGVALVTEFRLVCVATHTGAIQAHDIFLLVARLISSHTITDYGNLPVFQKLFMINPNEGLRFNTLLFSLICGKFRLGDITGFSAHRVMPNWIGDQPKKDDQS
jgi:hypothetical protein